MSNRAYHLTVEPPQKHNKDNFTMLVPAINVAVLPDEQEPWQLQLQLQEGELGAEGQPEYFSRIDVKFEGHPTNETGYQAALIRFFLPDAYSWFGNGLEVVELVDRVNLLDPQPHFNHYLSRKSDQEITLTIEVENQVAFSSELRFRFKVVEESFHDDDKYKTGGVRTKVLVSEDPSVHPTKPIGD